ncbi:hypothetical protein ACWDA3_26165 [Nonomuraea rubra]
MALSPPPEAIAELEARFPEWTIRVSACRRIWAIRQETKLLPGCRTTVDADDLEALADELDRQEKLRGGSSR